MLLHIGVSNQAASWFNNYLSARTQCVQLEGSKLSFLTVSKGVPQGSVLGPILFSIYVNDLCQNQNNQMLCTTYADDTIIYCCAVECAFDLLQSAFEVVQCRLLKLEFVLNADKSKVMLFSNARLPATPPDLVTSQGNVIDLVPSYSTLALLSTTNCLLRLIPPAWSVTLRSS